MFSNRIRTLALSLMALVAVGCAEGTTTAGTTAPTPVALIFSADVTGSTLNTLVITVTASDITTPLVFNITLPSGSNVASGTVKLPPGSARTITVRGYNASGVETYEGSKTIDVTPGQNPAVSIPLLPLTGQVPITATLGPVTVSLASSSSSLISGYTMQLAATITAPNGDILSGPADWATSNPAIATVDQNGKVTALAPGSVQITADYEGVAGSTQLTVTTSTVFADGFDANAIGSAWSMLDPNRSQYAYFGLWSAPNGQRFFGWFTSETVGLSVSSLPPHSFVTLAFDFEALGPLQGNNGSAVFRVDALDDKGTKTTCVGPTNFSNNPASLQAYPDVANGSNSHPAFTGSSVVGALGYNSTNWPGGGGADATYRITCQIPNTSNVIYFQFDGHSVNDVTNERWGIDNVLVTVQQ